MPAQITLVRHAETLYNAEHRWQGSTNAPLTDRGHAQLASLAHRLHDTSYDVVVSSDLDRAAATAAAVHPDFITDSRWREPHVGEWEGLTHAEIQARYPGDLQRLLDGDDVALGGGERMSDVAARLDAAFVDLVAQLGDEGSALVVSHGLALLTLLADQLAAKRPTPMRLMSNTAISTIAVNSHGAHLISYNDAGHVAENGAGPGPAAEVLLIRHGQTDANVEQRWQGHGDWPLNDTGRAQAQELAQRLPPVDAVYSSPLLRARNTAQAVADEQSHEVAVDDRLKEIGFGAWENRTKADIEETDPDGLATLMSNDSDVRRGGSGETFTEVQNRMAEAVDEIAANHDRGSIAVVSHGGATRAYVTQLLGLDFRGRYRIGTLRNTGVGRIEYGKRGPLLAQWNSSA
jgi:broad specificity phosphatase PhoE